MWWLWIYSTFMLCVQWYVKTGIVLLFSVGMKRTIYQHFLQNTLHLYGLYYSLILNIVLIIIIALLEISSPLNFILSISLTSFAFSLYLSLSRSLFLIHSPNFVNIICANCELETVKCNLSRRKLKLTKKLHWHFAFSYNVVKVEKFVH